MALRTIIEKLQGNYTSCFLPILVYDDAGAAITASQAVQAAESLAPTEIFTASQTGDPGIEQLTDSAYRVAIKYADQGIGVFVSQERGTHNATAETLSLMWAEPVARFPANATDLKGVIVDGNPFSFRFGAEIPPGPETTAKQVQMNVVEFTPAVLRALTIWTREGVVNSTPIRGYAAGELQMVTFRAIQDSPTTMQVYLGYSGKPNVSGLTVGDVTGIAHEGHDHVYYATKLFTDRNNHRVGYVAEAAHVVRPRPRQNLNSLPVQLHPLPIA